MTTPQTAEKTPHEIKLEQAPALLRFGYLFTSKLRERAGVSPDSNTPVTAPMLGLRTTLVRGEEGVKLFYDTDRVKRHGAMPTFIKGPLFGEGAVHDLDDQAHSTRKNQMADLAYDDGEVARFKPLVAEEVEKVLARWSAEGEGTVYESMSVAFGRAAFRWAGLPMSDAEMDKRAHQYSRLLDSFGKLSTNAVAWLDRRRLDAWAAKMIEDVRSGAVKAPEGSVLARVADLRDENGELVDAKTTGIELQNLTRPTAAVGRFAAFAAAALVEHPEWAEKIRTASAAQGGSLTDIPESIAFAQEVRRFYPFVPVLPALATKDTEVSGCPIHKGQRILIDIFGTNTDPNEWKNAGAFEPERFLGVDDYEAITSFIPQGGGPVRGGHRCPGEKIAISALSTAVTALARESVTISSSPEDRSFPWTTFLTRPKSGVRVTVA